MTALLQSSPLREMVVELGARDSIDALLVRTIRQQPGGGATEWWIRFSRGGSCEIECRVKDRDGNQTDLLHQTCNASLDSVRRTLDEVGFWHARDLFEVRDGVHRTLAYADRKRQRQVKTSTSGADADGHALFRGTEHLFRSGNAGGQEQ